MDAKDANTAENTEKVKTPRRYGEEKRAANLAEIDRKIAKAEAYLEKLKQDREEEVAKVYSKKRGRKKSAATQAKELLQQLKESGFTNEEIVAKLSRNDNNV